MFRDFERASRKARFSFVALVHVLLTLAWLLPDATEASLQWLADFWQVRILQCFEALLNLLRVTLRRLQVDPIHLNGQHPPQLTALLDHQ